VGLPETLDPFASRTLGLELVRTLVRQLGGAVAWRRGRGTEVVIEFSDGS
jgi:two-component sensor histidine kinase